MYLRVDKEKEETLAKNMRARKALKQHQMHDYGTSDSRINLQLVMMKIILTAENC